MDRFPPRKPEELTTDEEKNLYTELSELKDNLFGDQYIHHRRTSRHFH